MWRWRYLKFPTLLKGVRSGNKNRLYTLLEQGEQDTLNQHEGNAASDHLPNDKYNSEWKIHVRAWSLLVEGLFYLCESHRLSFSDSLINTKACKKIIASISTQPTSTACLVFAYVLFLVNSFDKVKNYLNEAVRLEPACHPYVNNMLLMTEGRLRAIVEDDTLHNSPKPARSDKSEVVKTEDTKLSSSTNNTLNSIDSNMATVSSSFSDNTISVTLQLKFTPAKVVSEEIILSIFAYLSVSELGRAGSVCKAWWRLAGDFSLWKAQYIKNVFVDPEYGNVDYKSMCKEINLVRRHWRIGECFEAPLHTFDDLVLCLQFDEERLISGTCNNTISIWDFKANKIIKTLHDHDAPVRSLQFNNSLFASGSSNVVKIWDPADFRCIHTLSNFEGEPVSLSLFRHLLACAVRDNVLLWNLEGIGNESFLDASNEIPGHNGAVNCVQFNDMHTLLSAGEDRTVKLWDIHSNRIVHNMAGHRSAIQAFHSDGEFVVSGGADGSLRFHDMRSKRCLETVQASQGAITCIQFNDFQILTGHITGAITHWDVRCSKWDQELLLAHTGAVSCLSFDRTKIISGSLDCSVRLWDFSSGFGHTTQSHDTGSSVRFSHFKATKNATSKYCNIV